jgi:hypothetical protein
VCVVCVCVCACSDLSQLEEALVEFEDANEIEPAWKVGGAVDGHLSSTFAYIQPSLHSWAKRTYDHWIH